MPLVTTLKSSEKTVGLASEVLELLGDFSGEPSVKRLFWELLSYDRSREPLPLHFLPPSAIPITTTLEVFAASEALTIVHIEIKHLPQSWQLEQIAWSLKRRLRECVVLVSYHPDWLLVYPDEKTRPKIRILPLPGPLENRGETATALAALNAADVASGDSLPDLEVSEELDKFFPGAMPDLGDLWEHFERYENHKNPQVRNLVPFIREVRTYPLLTAQQEWGEDLRGDEVPPDGSKLPYFEWRLVVRNLRLPLWMARGVPRMEMDLADLVQEGAIGLMIAARRFDTNRRYRFSTYAFWWVRQTMLRGLHNQCNLIRWPVWVADKLISAHIEGSEEGLSAGEKPVLYLRWRTANLAFRDAGAVDATVTREIREGVQRVLQELRPQQRIVIERRFGIGNDREETLEEIGQDFGVTRERIRQIEAKALKKLSGKISELLKPLQAASEWRLQCKPEEYYVAPSRAANPVWMNL